MASALLYLAMHLTLFTSWMDFWIHSKLPTNFYFLVDMSTWLATAFLKRSCLSVSSF